ncbi:MAG: FapA family protein [Desulfonauticus sp.]|nr:FapA family protein [Desulfonauticus sp.]
MLYYLKHYFDPDFDYQNLKPKLNEKGQADHFNLDYVQNVRKGDVLAEWQEISEGDASKYDERFVSDKKKWPLGPNVAVNPKNKDQIIATADGYVFYFQDKIAVKTVLNVRRDVDFHTGNIYFVGDMIVHGNVRSGFKIKAKNIRIKGNVEGAKIFAKGSLVIEGGIKGAGEAEIRAQGNVKVSFCEKASLRAGEKLLIEGSALHSQLFCKKILIVNGRLQGGIATSGNLIYVKEQLGGGMGVKTELVLGYDSDLLQINFALEKKIGELYKQVHNLTLKIEREQNKQLINNFQQDMKRLEKKIKILRKARKKVHEILNDEFKGKAKVICPGKIRPGVEVSIGPYYYKVDDFLENGKFVVENDDIVFKQPALDK